MSDTISLESYIKLLDREQVIPKIIETNAEYAQFLEIVEKLMSRKKLRTSEETALFRLLVKLIRDYEEETYSLKEWSQTAVE
jgi:HTH-type transcriptional regulator / antitoxin HigA